MAAISVELAGRTWRLIGHHGPITDAVEAALVANGAVRADGSTVPQLLIVSQPLLPEAGHDDSLVQRTANAGRQMAAGAGGRIVVLLSAIAGLPVKHHPDYSAGMAAALAGMRVLAMQLAPGVLVNAVGAGVVADGATVLAGDGRMLSHVALGRPGTVEDIVGAVLFLCDPMNTYTTGLILNVDGGWTVGYGRNF